MKPASAGWKIVAVLATALLSAALCLAQADNADSSPAKAGWAQVDITPPLGIALGGRGGPETPADRVLDPLFAQVCP